MARDSDDKTERSCAILRTADGVCLSTVVRVPVEHPYHVYCCPDACVCVATFYSPQEVLEFMTEFISFPLFVVGPSLSVTP